MPRLTDILGQDQATDVLRRAMESGKLAHAYLFVGPEGVGKASCATSLFAALNCESAPGEGCESCISCHKIANALHPDLLHLQPEGAFIKIGQVREVEEHLSFTPHEGRYRLVLIDGADRLNPNAANALLKSVEEPRPRTLFVLSASAGHLVTPTLVSRCQRIRFVPLSPEQVLEVVRRHSEATEEDRRAAAALAEGSPRRALKLLGGEQMATIQRTVRALLDGAGRHQVLPVFEAAAEAGRDRQLLQETLDVMRVWLRDLLLCREGLEQGRVVNSDQLAQLRQEAQRVSTPALLEQLRAVGEAQAALRGNVHPTLTLEHLVLRMRQVVEAGVS